MCSLDCQQRILVDERVQCSVAFAEASLDVLGIHGLVHPLLIHSASNAGLQLLPEAGLKDEGTLEAGACNALLAARLGLT